MIQYFKINTQILEHFIRIDKLSAYRLLTYVKDRFNNHLHIEDLKIITKELQISSNVVYQNLSQLIKLGWIVEYSKGYWRFKSWKTFSNSKNRIIDISLEHLKSIKHIRTYYYNFKYRASFKISKRNVEPDQRHGSSMFPVSARFVKLVTGLSNSTSSILRQLKKAEELNLIKVFRSSNIMCKVSTFEKAFQAASNIDNAFIKKLSSCCFAVITHNSNLINFI